MSNVFLGQHAPDAIKVLIFSFTAAAVTEAFQLAVGTRVRGVSAVITSATGRAPTYAYNEATGVLTVGAIVAADTGYIAVTVH